MRFRNDRRVALHHEFLCGILSAERTLATDVLRRAIRCHDREIGPGEAAVKLVAADAAPCGVVIGATGIEAGADDVEQVGKILAQSTDRCRPGRRWCRRGAWRRTWPAASGVRVARTFHSAWASTFGPPQTGTQSGRGSSRSSARIRASEPAESLPSPTPCMP